MGKLDGRVALITGASGGIGRATALLFAQEGASIVAVDVNTEEGHETIDLVKQISSEVIYCHADVSKSDDCKNMVSIAEERFGGLHILFNNAGIMHPDEVMQCIPENLDLTMDVNLKGVFLGCKFGIPAQRSGGGV